MDKHTHWAERARSSLDAKQVFSNTADAGLLIDHLFFGVSSPGLGAIGAYVEFYQDKSNEVVTAFVLTYAAPYDDVSDEIKASVAQYRLLDTGSQAVDLPCPTLVGKTYRIRILGKVNTGVDSGAVLSDVHARLERDYSATHVFNDLNILPVKWPDREHNVKISGQFVSSARALCPNCLGKGSFATMKIPRADWESGATGYALFSCNQLNGREACDICGGSGGTYLPWYLAEHPELRPVIN